MYADGDYLMSEAGCSVGMKYRLAIEQLYGARNHDAQISENIMNLSGTIFAISNRSYMWQGNSSS